VRLLVNADAPYMLVRMQRNHRIARETETQNGASGE
jgi:hypothetical protein